MTRSFDVLSTAISISFTPVGRTTCCFQVFTFFSKYISVVEFEIVLYLGPQTGRRASERERKQRRHWNEMYSSRINFVFIQLDLKVIHTHHAWLKRKNDSCDTTKSSQDTKFIFIDDVNDTSLGVDLRANRYQNDLVVMAELFPLFREMKKLLNFAFVTYVAIVHSHALPLSSGIALKAKRLNPKIGMNILVFLF